VTAAQFEDAEGHALVAAIHERKRREEATAKLMEALKNRPLTAIVCYTKCWSCQFGEHASEWHTWADADDIQYAANTGQADPSSQRCGCYCQREVTVPTTTRPIHLPTDEERA
jgi:hypothetical protein